MTTQVYITYYTPQKYFEKNVVQQWWEQLPELLSTVKHVLTIFKSDNNFFCVFFNLLSCDVR